MKSLTKIWSVLSTVLAAVIVILAILLVGVRVVGITPYVVLSGSMEPTYHVGSIIYDKKADPADIEIGTPVTFVLHGSQTLVTHRVIAISDDGKYYTTQGDANDSPDGQPVYKDNVLGVPVFCIPKLGYFSNWISHTPGSYVGIAVLAVLVFSMFVPDLLKDGNQEAQACQRDEGQGAHTYQKDEKQESPA